MLRVTPIYGSQWEERGPAPSGYCTLVEYANVQVLVNVGGIEAEEQQHHQKLFCSLPPHDCLILTDSTLEHMGSLPMYCNAMKQQHNGTVPPIYATFPTVKMGQMTLYDHHANLCLDGGTPPYSLEDMDDAISRINTIKYSQPIWLPHYKVNSSLTIQQAQQQNHQHHLSITAHRAGHVVGGAFYVLQRLQDETSVVMTSTNYHIAKELHLDSSTLLKDGATPDVLMTFPGGPAMKLMGQLYATNKKMQPPLVTQAQRNVVEHVLSVLRRDGNVLLPVDAAGRVLELVLLLSQHWERHRLQGTYNLVWLGPMVGNTIDFCRSQLEWMATALGNQFDAPQQGGGGGGGRQGGGGGAGGMGHPYALKPVQFCTNVDELEALIAKNNNPTCVLASGMNLDHGPARDLLVKWANNDNHAILFTDSAQCHARRRTTRASATPGAVGDGVTGEPQLVEDAAKNNVNPLTKPMMMAPGAGSGPATTATAAAAADGKANIMVVEDETQEEDQAATMILAARDTSPYSTAYQLLYHWCQAKLEQREMEDSVTVDVLVPRRAPLAGAELKQFLEQEEAARLSRKQQAEQAAMLREVELAKGQLRLGEDQQTQSQSQQSSTLSAAIKSSTMKSTKFFFRKKKSRFDSSLFLKFSKPLHLTFEVREDAVGVGRKDATNKLFGIVGDSNADGEGTGGGSGNNAATSVEDDYGIAVIPEHFVDIVTGVDPSKFAGGSGRIGEEVLRRGLGYGVGGDPNADASSQKNKKKRKKGVGGDDDGEEGDEELLLDERAMEATDLSEGRGIIRGRNGRPPTKVTTVPRRLQVFAEIDYIPLEGRVSSRAARQSVRALQPRQVIVLGGPKPESTDGDEEKGEKKDQILTIDEVRTLAEAAQSFTTSKRTVQAPSDGESVELEVGHAAYSVRLIANPYRTREEKEKEEEPPEPIELHEAKLGACTVSLLDYVATGQKVALDGSIVLAPRKATRSSQPSSVYVSDGEVLLTDLRTELIAEGMKAEYSTHSGYSQLVINGKVIVKKANDTGKIDVEGPLCEDFFTVRSIVCGQYVTL